MFIKGSPEKILELADKSSVPEDYSEILNNLTMEGFRVLGLGYRELNVNLDLNNLRREEAEQNIIFVGIDINIIMNIIKKKYI